ncbi:hypothetical protein P692DRAFT_201581851 [Suillus brevipes Sb2]|nr:hypothetical protein P692DRAFT_201581851 [Suillus brevipes Sb2]
MPRSPERAAMETLGRACLDPETAINVVAVVAPPEVLSVHTWLYARSIGGKHNLKLRTFHLIIIFSLDSPNSVQILVLTAPQVRSEADFSSRYPNHKGVHAEKYSKIFKNIFTQQRDLDVWVSHHAGMLHTIAALW